MRCRLGSAGYMQYRMRASHPLARPSPASHTIHGGESSRGAFTLSDSCRTTGSRTSEGGDWSFIAEARVALPLRSIHGDAFGDRWLAPREPRRHMGVGIVVCGSEPPPAGCARDCPSSGKSGVTNSSRAFDACCGCVPPPAVARGARGGGGPIADCPSVRQRNVGLPWLSAGRPSPSGAAPASRLLRFMPGLLPGLLPAGGLPPGTETRCRSGLL